MTRIILIASLLALSAALAGCGGGDPEPEEEQQQGEKLPPDNCPQPPSPVTCK